MVSNFFLIVNILILLSLIIIGVIGFKYYLSFKKEKLLEEQRKKMRKKNFQNLRRK